MARCRSSVVSALCPCHCSLGYSGKKEEERRRRAVNSLINGRDGSTCTHTHIELWAHTTINRFLKSISVNKKGK